MNPISAQGIKELLIFALGLMVLCVGAVTLAFVSGFVFKFLAYFFVLGWNMI